MGLVNLRKAACFALFGMRGQALGANYREMMRQEHDGIPSGTTSRLLVEILAHCSQSVPYYRELMRGREREFREDPEAFLSHFPVLTKETIRTCSRQLESEDLARRKWYFNTSGGSTGEPVRFVQDRDYAARSGAATLLYSKLAGRELGQLEINLWGSHRDIASLNWRARLLNILTNTEFLDACLMAPERMREYVAVMNARRPKLIVAYVDALYQLAMFIEREGLDIVPQAAAIVSAGTLHPFMREKIQAVFRCQVFNRYGSREVGDIACERPGCSGLWVAPWANYIEIVDEAGRCVPNGTEGEILVTSLTNFAMPMIRYRIGDRGVLALHGGCPQEGHAQVLQAVLGRSGDMFRTRNGTLIHAAYFINMLFFKDWIKRYQVIQEDYGRLVFRIVRSGEACQPAELDEIVTKTRRALGDDCQVVFDFVEDIPATSSGKYRYTISEVSA